MERRSEARESARLEMPEPMRRDVRLLGELLGQVIAEGGGPDLLEDVERLRRAVIAARDSAEQEVAAERLVASWPLERAEEVARAFTCYFHLANLAEEQHRARVLREREQGAGYRESLAATVAEIRSEQGEARLRALLDGLELHPVLTAHPTEARRRAVVLAIRRVGEQLQRLDDPRCTDVEERDVRLRLLEAIDVLWRTAQLRSTQLEPMDEVRATLAVFEETLLAVVPAIYRGLDTALAPADAGARPTLAPAFLRFGTWVGGDRDGNPHVTAVVTAEAMREQSRQALLAMEAAVIRVGRVLTADAASTPPSAELERRLARARSIEPERMAVLVQRAPGEPHRQFLVHVADRLRATREREPALAYASPDELLADLRVAQASLAGAGAVRQAYGELQHLVWQAETFGFHLAELEIRQHSRVHERALAEVRAGGARSPETEEVLATLRTVADLQRAYGVGACRRYVVSFTRGAGDLAAVFDLAAAACDPPPVLDVVPLFETGEDLRRATAILDEVAELPSMRRRLAETGALEVMLGYSDSAKEGGTVFATLALFDAQAALAAWAARRGLRLTLFHGRGGALGRGGGPANRAVLAQAPGSVAGRFKVTEQGEVIFARYGNFAIAARHLEQVASAVLQASSPSVGLHAARTADRFRGLAARIGPPAHAAYRLLVEADGFPAWFGQVSPIDELGSLRIGSRPARRGGGRALEDLRAIPWVFAWSQTRLNLPGWYGLGSGLAAAELDEVREAYAEWPLFTSLIDNAEMSLAKTDRRIAARYLDLGDRPDLAERVLAEYDRTLEGLLAITGHRRLLERRRVLGRAVELRNPYVDALSHLQLRALRTLRAGGLEAAARERVERLLLLTVNGVAAGLQNTG
ncbi:MAG TPA: phosphoenolpyruvate carboxylase [Candidatus Dormibacteraeota bacterium]|nr:phosphoenolpyruvate carboxylase [Candidatus Dormibacteraeota bacterium]